MAELLTTAEAAAVLRCTTRTIRREVRRGHLVPIVVNTRRNLYRAADLEDYLTERRADDRAVLRAALQLLAEHHAEETRPLCPECGKRRVVRGLDWCRPCSEQRDNQLADKRAWWHRNHGSSTDQATA